MSNLDNDFYKINVEYSYQVSNLDFQPLNQALQIHQGMPCSDCPLPDVVVDFNVPIGLRVCGHKHICGIKTSLGIKQIQVVPSMHRQKSLINLFKACFLSFTM